MPNAFSRQSHDLHSWGEKSWELFHSGHGSLVFLTWWLRLGSPALLAFGTSRLTMLLERSRNSVLVRCLPSSASVATTALGTQSPRNPLWLGREVPSGKKIWLGRESRRVINSCGKWTREKSDVLYRAAMGSLKLTEQGVGWRLANLRWPSLPLECLLPGKRKSVFYTRGHFNVWWSSRTQGQGRDRVVAGLCPGRLYSPAWLNWTTLPTFSDFTNVKQQNALSFSWVHFRKFSPDIGHWRVPGTGDGGAILTLSQWPFFKYSDPLAMGDL